MKTKKKYSYLDNLKFVVNKHWKYSKEYVICQIILTPFGALSSLISAFLPKVVLDCVEKNSTFSELILNVGIMSVIMLISNYLNKVLNLKCIEGRNIANMGLFHSLLCKKIMDMDYNNYIYNETRVLREKAYKSINSWDAATHRFFELNCTIASVVFGFSAFTTIIAKCNPIFIPILVICYFLSALGWLILQKYKDKIKEKVSAVFLKLEYVSYRSKDFSNAKDIRIYNMTGFLMCKIDKHLDEIHYFNKKRNNGHFYNVIFEDLLKFAVSLAAYLYLIYLKLNSEMTLGDFSLYFGAITGFGTWLNKLVDGIAELISASHNVNDFREFLDIPNKMNTGKGVSLPDKKTYPCEIKLENISFYYSGCEKPTLDNISLKINKGEKVAIVGTNGAGKSTLVKLICGLLIPTEGKILLNGIESDNFNRDEYYTLFSTVFQDCALLPSTVAKNIALCEEEKIDRKRLFECMVNADIFEKINSLPQKENTLLVREVNEGGISLSGGELQRLLLARSLYKNSPFIILDEPTAALDPIAENEMYLKYNSFTKNKTALYISHRLSSTRFCDRIILLDNGKIIEEGTHEELIALNEKYAEMYATQSKYYKKEAIM